MPSPFWENLDEFFSTQEFAVEATLKFADQSPDRAVVGNFDDGYEMPRLGEFERDHQGPIFVGKSSGLEGVTRGDSLVVAGKTYTVLTAPQDDGTGIACLELSDVV